MVNEINRINSYAHHLTFIKSPVVPPADKTNSVTNHQQQSSLPLQISGLAKGPELSAGTGSDAGLALFALGIAAVKEWENSGLEISQETMDAASRLFKSAAKEVFETGATGGVAFNGHQIVINNQDVPAWFLGDHQATLDAMDESYTRDAFIAGELYALGPPTLSIKV